MRNVYAFVMAGCMLAGASSAAAQNYPNKPIRFITPYAPGGSTSVMARMIGQHLTECWGQNVIIDNRPGGNTIIGTETVARSAPDGYTILLVTSTLSILSSLTKTPYDPVKDFAPVSQGTYYGYVLIVHPGVAAKNVKELVELARAKPMSYASAGNGSAAHLAGEFFAAMAKVKLNHVPYKGSGPALVDVLAGQVPIMFDTPITTIPQAKAGKVRGLAFSGKRRIAQLSDIPTMEESGFKGFEVSSWQGVITTAGTPKVAIQRLHQATVKALKMPDIVDRLATQGGNELVGSSPEEYAQLIRDELAKYAKIIREAGIKAE